MPYRSNRDLPASVRAHLPPEAQDIYRSAFNNAWQEYARREPERLEEIGQPSSAGSTRPTGTGCRTRSVLGRPWISIRE